jgi:4-alpha-glucanotransferase
VESHIHRVRVIGESLGTVPDGFLEMLHHQGIFSMCVLFFQRDWNGVFYFPEHYPQKTLLTVTTHDFAPLKAYLTLEDLHMRFAMGHFEDEQAYQNACEERKKTWNSLLHSLKSKHLIENMGLEDVTYAMWLKALYAWVKSSPCAMLAYGLEELSEEIKPVNIPGLGMDSYRHWSRKMTYTLETLCAKDYTGLL